MEHLLPGLIEFFDIEFFTVFGRQRFSKGLGIIVHKVDKDFSGQLVLRCGRFPCPFFGRKFIDSCTSAEKGQRCEHKKEAEVLYFFHKKNLFNKLVFP